jgi:hypothetical protein
MENLHMIYEKLNLLIMVFILSRLCNNNYINKYITEITNCMLICNIQNIFEKT